MKNLVKFCLFNLLIILLLQSNLKAQPFTDINAGLMGLTVGSSAWGDYDNDSDLDLIITGWDGTEEYSIVYRNDNGNFVNINANLIPVAYGSAVAWGDYDNDGDLDILLSGRIDDVSRVTKIYRNDNGNFTDINAGLYGLSGSCVAWGDYDNDGDLDFIITGWDGYTQDTRIYQNNGGNFTSIYTGIIGVAQGGLAWGDYDNDGDLDILITGLDNSSSSNSRVYNNNNGIFSDIYASLEPTGNGGSAAWGDYDNDGDLDIVETGINYYGIFSRIYSNENGFFYNIFVNNIANVYQSSSAWGDYDNDGDLDLLLCGYDNSFYYSNIYRNDNGDFVNIDAGLTGINNRNGAIWGDYDNDGDMDILIKGYDGSNYITKIYRNDIATANTVPASPSNLLSSQTGSNRVNLKWNRSNDNQTSQKGLTYNLRIGTTSGGVNKFSPMSDLINGYRRLPSLGNTNHDTSWTIYNLPSGTYYWSVQAIDNSFAGSNFAEEQTFFIASQLIEPAWTIMVRDINTVPAGPVGTGGSYQDSLLQFSVYLMHTNPGYSDPFTYCLTQLYWNYNTAISDGTLKISKLGSDLPPSNQPTTFQVASGQFRVTQNTFSNQNFIVSSVFPGTMIVRLQVRTSSTIWNPVPHNIAWRSSLPNPYTKVYYYKPDGSSVELPDRVNNFFTVESNNLLPVELSSFTSETNKDKVILNWSTATETNNSGFDVERKSVNKKEWIIVGTVAGSGTTNEAKNYIFTDKAGTGTYNYRLKQIDFNGNFEYFNLDNEVEVGIPSAFYLSQNYPNPFNPSTKIRFEISAKSEVKLYVYDLLGRIVRKLVDEQLNPGFYETELDGSMLSSGVYFYKIEAGEFVETKRMMLIK